MRPGSVKSSWSTETSPVRIFTGSARKITHFRKLSSFRPLNNLCRMRLNSPDLANLPRAEKAALNARPINEIVGGPPMKTLVGMARLTVVGRSMAFGGPFFFSRGGLGIPATWQLSVGTEVNENGQPSATTVELPMKISSSLSGSFGTKGKPGGI